jgi:hypothetical protein
LSLVSAKFRYLGHLRKAISHQEQRIGIAREIGARQIVAQASWNLGHALEQQEDLAQVVELMQVRVDYECEIGHAKAEERAAELEQLPLATKTG